MSSAAVGGAGAVAELPTPRGGRLSLSSPAPRSGLAWFRRRRGYELCVFALATVMLASACVSTYMILRTQPALVAPVSRVLRLYCDKISNVTALQKFLNMHNTKLDPADIRDVKHHPDMMGSDNAAAMAKASCNCDCAVDVAAAVAAKSCPNDCSRCGGGGDGGGSGAIAAALAAGNVRSLSGQDLRDAVERDLRARFTDASCFLYGDESEVCAYEHAICYDGQNVVFTVPHAPAPHKQDPGGLGLVLGDPTGACFDYRYYEPTALEYTTCKYDMFKFQRTQRYSTQPYPSPGASKSPKPKKGVSPSASPSRTGSPSNRPPKPTFGHKSDWPLPLTHRRWGPLNRGAVRFREVPDTIVFGPRPGGLEVTADGAVIVKDHVTVGKGINNGLRGSIRQGHFFKGFDRATDTVYRNLTAAGMRIVSVARYAAPSPPPPPPNATAPALKRDPITVYWTDGSVWFSAMDAQFDRHIYHATTRLIGLYHAQRQNRSNWGDNEADGNLPPLGQFNHPIENTFMRWVRHSIGVGDAAVTDALRLAGLAPKGAAAAAAAAGAGAATVLRPNRQQFHTGSDWDLPPQDYVLVTGPSANFASPDKMITFLKGLTELVAQPHTRWLTNVHLGVLSPNTSLLCARRGAITGTHPRLFVNRADAWMFRKNAYDYAGVGEALGLQAHPHHPPRKITVLLRKGKAGRNFENIAEVQRLIEATGLPVEYIDDMGKLSFKQQIGRMAGTGILIAAHGAALVNAMFLPQHAVVIEIFPWKFKKATYINLAAMLGLWHLPVYTGQPNMTDMSFYGIRMAWQNSSTGQNFFDGCVKANVSAVDALLHFRCNAVSKALPILVPPAKLKDALDEALDIIAAYSEFNSEWRPQLERLQGRITPTRTSTRTPKPSKGAQAQGKGGGNNSNNSTTGKNNNKAGASPSATKKAASAAKTAGASGSKTASKLAASKSPTASKSVSGLRKQQEHDPVAALDSLAGGDDGAGAAAVR